MYQKADCFTFHTLKLESMTLNICQFPGRTLNSQVFSCNCFVHQAILSNEHSYLKFSYVKYKKSSILETESYSEVAVHLKALQSSQASRI